MFEKDIRQEIDSLVFKGLLQFQALSVPFNSRNCNSSLDNAFLLGLELFLDLAAIGSHIIKVFYLSHNEGHIGASQTSER